MDNSTILQHQQALVDLMRKNGSLKSEAVERAFMAVPRHIFLPAEPIERAYSDIAIAVRKSSEDQWTSSSSQPTMMAIMLEQLDLRPGMRVLEIGTGTGFNTALIAEIVGPQGRVVTMDIQPDLIEEARERLEALGYTWVQAVAGDGGYGFPEGAPYDRVILTVGSEVISPAWREQLVEGGRLVLPLTIGKTQKSIAFERQGTSLVSASISDCGFMMLQGAFAGEEPVRTRVGDDERLFILSSTPLPVDGAQIAAWLEKQAADQPTGAAVKEFEAWGGLPTWLALKQQNFGVLIAEGNLGPQGAPLPAAWPEMLYMGHGSDFRVKQSFVLVGAGGAAAITRPPGDLAPFRDWNSPPDEEDRPPEQPFALYVRQFGPDPGPAQRLLSLVQAWAEKGRPGTESMHIRAFPATEACQLAPGEYLLEKAWTNLVISFNQ